jgi:hypothetical protein
VENILENGTISLITSEFIQMRNHMFVTLKDVDLVSLKEQTSTNILKFIQGLRDLAALIALVCFSLTSILK